MYKRQILDRKEHPKEGSYTNYLFDKGIDKILKKDVSKRQLKSSLPVRRWMRTAYG